MINIKFYKNRSHIVGFEITGHSNLYNKFFSHLLYKLGIKKKDYICSAVSATAYMTVLGLKNVYKKEIQFKVNDSGFMECILLRKPDKECEKLFKTFMLTLREIEKEYPGNIEMGTEVSSLNLLKKLRNPTR